MTASRELQSTPRRWQDILLNRKMVTCVFLGFTSGMPLYVLFQLVPAWLRSHQVDLATIGLLRWFHCRIPGSLSGRP